jgi:hypothetical protein
MGLSKADTMMLHAIERGLRIEKDGTVIGTKGLPIKGSIISRCKKQKGQREYLASVYRHKGQKAKIRFHRLQAYTKYGDALFEEGIETRHGEGGPLDNSWDNITIGTHKDNMNDVSEEDRRNSSMKRAKVSDEQILEIRSLRAAGVSPVVIGEQYGINRFTVWRFCRDIPLSKVRKLPGR